MMPGRARTDERPFYWEQYKTQYRQPYCERMRSLVEEVIAYNSGKDEKHKNTNHRRWREQAVVAQKVSYGGAHEVDVGKQHEPLVRGRSAPEEEGPDDEQGKRKQVAEIEDRSSCSVQLPADLLISAEIKSAPDHRYCCLEAKRDKDGKDKGRSETEPSMPRNTPGADQ
jgi:hypothetical protein